MKKQILKIIALTVFAIITQSCATHNLNKFMGVWKRIDKSDKGKDTTIIKKENNAIVGILGKDTCIGMYDKKTNVLKFYVMGSAGVVSYDEKTGHILLNKGDDGVLQRIK